MMRSMFSGVSGLRAHQTRMDVIGNNVANVNTVGFKSGRVTFQEVFSQTLRGAGAPDTTTGRGGTNPMQVGLGIGVGTVDTLTTRGSLQRTDNPTDLSIEGEGLFILKGGSADTFKFTRAGNFGVDKLGNLVSGSGLNLMGWHNYTTEPDGTYKFDTEQPLEAINLYTGGPVQNKRMIPAKATENALFAGNLNASETPVGSAFDNTGNCLDSNVHFTVPMTVYDSLGNDYKINVKMWKVFADTGGSQWYYKVQASDASAADIDTIMAGAGAAEGFLEFGPDGKPVDPPVLGTTVNFTNDITITPVDAAGTAPFTLKLDFTKLSSYNADSSAKPTNIDGYPTGNLVTFNIGSDGILTGIYSNGQQQPLGMVALASFENPAGLQKVGENMYIPTTNSGDFKKGLKAGSEGVGTLNPGTLEMSNVDLSREFTDMITTQRGFQANSRIITTSDEMLQELVNLKR